MAKVYTNLAHTARNILEGKPVGENDERQPSDKFDPAATEKATPPKKGGKEKLPSKDSSDENDPNTINIGEVTPVDLDPTTEPPKPSDTELDKKGGKNVKKGADQDQKVVEEYKPARTIGKGIFFRNYHRSIAKKVRDIVVTHQGLADKHKIRPWGTSSVEPAKAPAKKKKTNEELDEGIGSIAVSAVNGLMRGLGVHAELPVPRPKKIGHKIGQNKPDVADDNKDSPDAETDNRPAPSPRPQASIQDRVFRAAVSGPKSNSDSNTQRQQFQHQSTPNTVIDKSKTDIGTQQQQQKPKVRVKMGRNVIESIITKVRSIVAEGKKITIHHHPDYDEYRVPNGAKGKGAGYFTNDKEDAEDTARHIHGADVEIKHRSKRYNTVEETQVEEVEALDEKALHKKKAWLRAVALTWAKREKHRHDNTEPHIKGGAGGKHEMRRPKGYAAYQARFDEVMGYNPHPGVSDVHKDLTYQDHLRLAQDSEKEAQQREASGHHDVVAMHRRIRDRHMAHYMAMAPKADLEALKSRMG